MLLADRVILVTGASSGIGLAALDVFSREGAIVIGTARRAAPAADTIAALRAAGRRVEFHASDVTDDASLAALFARIDSDHGRLDGAFNNAAVTQDAFPIESIPEQVFDEVFAANVKGTFACLQHEFRRMRGRGGAIVNTSSIAGIRGYPGLAAYSASKHAILGLTRCAALDGATARIRVNAICPGTTRTPMMERQMLTRPNGVEATLARIPLGRFASADEPAEAAAWLLSDRAAFVTGQEIAVDGGRTTS